MTDSHGLDGSSASLKRRPMGFSPGQNVVASFAFTSATGVRLRSSSARKVRAGISLTSNVSGQLPATPA